MSHLILLLLGGVPPISQEAIGPPIPSEVNIGIVLYDRLSPFWPKLYDTTIQSRKETRINDNGWEEVYWVVRLEFVYAKTLTEREREVATRLLRRHVPTTLQDAPATCWVTSVKWAQQADGKWEASYLGTIRPH